jgi:hypothetical protein
MKKSVFLILVILLSLTACEKENLSEGYPEMESFYVESCGLQTVTTDSVKSFSAKVDDFTAKWPDSKGHSLYPKIQANIRQANFRITITINDEWDGETHINF